MYVGPNVDIMREAESNYFLIENIEFKKIKK
jgi:hypothetical protein